MEPRSAAAITEMALGRPSAISVVPSTGSTAMSTAEPSPLPTSSPLYSMGASSFSPSPMTTTPRMATELIIWRMASTAAPSPDSFCPRPTHLPDAKAAASVTRTNSMARLRSGASFLRSADGLTFAVAVMCTNSFRRFLLSIAVVHCDTVAPFRAQTTPPIGGLSAG